MKKESKKMVNYNYNNIKWTEQDERQLKKIVNNFKYYLMYFLIGMLTGVIIFIILKIISHNGLFNEFGGILW